MYSSIQDASNLPKSALIVPDLLQRNPVNLKDGDKLNVTGMSGGQLEQVLNLLVKQCFQGHIKTNQDDENKYNSFKMVDIYFANFGRSLLVCPSCQRTQCTQRYEFFCY
ncbi:hypothetical protein GVN16_10440 [Emticicia sp. CRIBPO]|uniref:hypothetical protein n=1 Tax=Emticicia sp. CRIBPO TaxID=2683258 RepID=UPI001411F644|nr:hypothetical protein [Emticicia sp. CRIBPO]NBA86181.1 hypothetical protein [Emticicia sp. CRIBPO]